MYILKYLTSKISNFTSDYWLLLREVDTFTVQGK